MLIFSRFVLEFQKFETNLVKDLIFTIILAYTIADSASISCRVGVIFMGYSILQEILQDAVRFFESCTAKLKEVSSKS